MYYSIKYYTIIIQYCGQRKGGLGIIFTEERILGHKKIQDMALEVCLEGGNVKINNIENVKKRVEWKLQKKPHLIAMLVFSYTREQLKHVSMLRRRIWKRERWKYAAERGDG